MTAPTDALIEMDDVSYAPGGVPVLSGISWRSNARRIGIVGRNGSGKTSMARVLAGLVPANQGRVRVMGVDVARNRTAALRAVGILFQNPDHQIIFPTVEEEIAFGLTQMKLPDEEVAAKVEAVLQRFGKSHWTRAAIHQLSQGQRQLVCLMSVIAMQPQVIILDEPFAGLDIPTTLQLRRVFDGLDLTLVHITHDPAMLAGYDRVLWVEEGKVERDGTATEICAAFSNHMRQLGEGDDLSDLAG
jgi:biotin transport system ATP-binding protein